MRCPVCKAENAQGPQCRRCKVDLTLLFQLEQEREQALGAARTDLAAGRWTEAVTEVSAANWMRSDEASRRLLAVAHLLKGDYAQAWRWYSEAREEGTLGTAPAGLHGR